MSPDQPSPRRFEVGVKSLVDFACRTGDLVLGAPLGPTAEEGRRAHAKLQKARQGKAETEVPVDFTITTTIEGESVTLRIRGRADVVYFSTLPPIIEEIKSTYCHPDRLPENARYQHLSQAKLYAFGLAKAHRWPSVNVQILYYDLGNKQTYEEDTPFEFAELEDFVKDTAEKYLHWMMKVDALRRKARADAQALSFPYDAFRPGQRTFSAEVYKAIRDKNDLMAQAPTGIGKTMSALFPAVKAYGESLLDKLLYLTAKQTGRVIALEAANSIAKAGCALTYVELRAKAKTCVCANGELCVQDGDTCPQTIGFFDRLPNAMVQLLEQGAMDADTVAAVALEHQLCAFELALQMLPWVDLVICDYNYLYDPLVRLGYFDDTTDKICALVDELHNLVDRSRGMYSGALNEADCAKLAGSLKGAGKYGSPYIASVRKIKSALKKVGKEAPVESAGKQPRLTDAEVSVELNGAPERLTRACEKLVEKVMSATAEGLPPPGVMKDWLKDVYRYIAINRLYNDNHRALAHLTLNKSQDYDWPVVELYCLNPADWLAEIHQKLHCAVMFSATVSPMDYYQKSLGFAVDEAGTVRTLDLPSPFPQENLRVMIANYIDTRWQYRNHAIPDICQLIKTVVSQKPGKYLVFFSSYGFMGKVHEKYQSMFPNDSEVMSQRQGMLDDERAVFLKEFEDNPEITIGFVIIGGIFAEGIDYIGERLIGAIIIGPGLPQPDLKNQLLTEKYEQDYQAGFDFAYKYPAMTRVLQSAGRVIRSETDKGVVVLVDRRFGRPDYLKQYPGHWQPWVVSNEQQLQNNLRGFWVNSH